MQKINRQIVQSKTVANVLASLRIEKLTPGGYVIQGMNACASGQRTTASLLQEIMQHHVAIRRD